MKKIHISEKQDSILNPFTSFNNIFSLHETELDSENKKIFEGLIKTYPPETVGRYLENYFDGKLKTRTIVSNGVEFIISTIPNDERYEKEAVRIMDNLCGYKLSRKGIRNDHKEIEFVFEPKFQKTINEEMEENEFLIHVSPSYNRNKILKYGFCPKFKNEIFGYNDRVYFYSSRTQPNAILSLSLGLAYSKDSDRTDHLFDFYMVDPKKINRNVEFHRDGMTSNGVAYWTYDNVPSNCIADIERMRCNGKFSTWYAVEE